MKILALAAILSVFAPAAQAQSEARAGRAALAFQASVAQAVPALPVDPFQFGECRAADSLHTSLKLSDAVDRLQGCARELWVRYDLPVTVSAGAVGVNPTRSGLVLGLVFRFGVPVDSFEQPAREIAHGLWLRRYELLNQRARLGRHDDQGVFAESSLQQTADRCTGIRIPPRTAEEFVLRYGDCLRANAKLRIRTIRVSPGDASRVEVYSRAKLDDVRAMNGLVVVRGLQDLVGFAIEANADHGIPTPRNP